MTLRHTLIYFTGWLSSRTVVQVQCSHMVVVTAYATLMQTSGLCSLMLISRHLHNQTLCMLRQEVFDD